MPTRGLMTRRADPMASRLIGVLMRQLVGTGENGRGMTRLRCIKQRDRISIRILQFEQTRLLGAVYRCRLVICVDGDGSLLAERIGVGRYMQSTVLTTLLTNWRLGLRT